MFKWQGRQMVFLRLLVTWEVKFKLSHLQVNAGLWPNSGIRHIIKSKNIFVNLSVCV